MSAKKGLAPRVFHATHACFHACHYEQVCVLSRLLSVNACPRCDVADWYSVSDCVSGLECD